MKIPFLNRGKDNTVQADKPVPKSNFLHEIRRDPFLDWALIVIFSSVAVLGLVGVGISVYLGSDARLREAAPDKGDKPTEFNIKALEEVLREFEDRETASANIRERYSGPRDPSLP